MPETEIAARTKCGQCGQAMTLSLPDTGALRDLVDRRLKIGFRCQCGEPVMGYFKVEERRTVDTEMVPATGWRPW